MVADVDGDDRVGRAGARDSASNTAAADTPRPRSSATRRAFSARQIAHRSATSGALVRRRRRSAERVGQSAATVSAASPSTSTVTGVEPADRGRVVVDLHDRLVRRDAGVVGERGARPRSAGRTRSSASWRPACRCGRARRRRAGGCPGTRPLALNVVSTGASSRSASCDDLGLGAAGAVPDDDHRPPGVARPASAARSRAASSGRIRPVGVAGRPGDAAGASRRQDLHLVGQHQVGDAAAVDARA